MMQTSNAIEPNPQENRYPFRSVSSNQLLHLTQPQLARIPYLSALIAHKDHFLSIQNEKGEYLLNDPIEYPSFIAILHSINSNNPYILLDQLPENENVLNTLELVDYLGLQSYSLPILRDVNLVRTNPDQNEDQRVKYERASLVEKRQTAAEFVVGIAKNEYQLDDPNTANNIFNLMNIIVSYSSVFSSSFRCHTLTIARKRCYPFFSKDQKRQLYGMHRSTLFNRRNPSTQLFGEEKTIPNDFDNAFNWKSVPVRDVDNHANSFSVDRERSRDWIKYYFRLLYDRNSPRTQMRISITTDQALKLCEPPRLELQDQITREISIEERKLAQRKKEAQSARSGYFDTIPKRPKVDKFKHRCGPKAQKYR